ncbi:hypothetical protein Peur_015813 [Populus x canadensis]
MTTIKKMSSIEYELDSESLQLLEENCLRLDDSKLPSIRYDQLALEVIKNIKQDWKLLILVKKESNDLRDLVTSEKYRGWRNLSLVIPMTLGFEANNSQAIEPTKIKRINKKKELKEQLEILQIEVGTNKALRISLKEQILIEEKLKKFVEQQLEENRINKKKMLREQLEILQIEVSIGKALRISLKKQILTEEKLKKFTEQ